MVTHPYQHKMRVSLLGWESFSQFRANDGWTSTFCALLMLSHFKFFLVALTCCSKHYEKATLEFSKSHQKTINIGPIFYTIDCLT